MSLPKAVVYVLRPDERLLTFTQREAPGAGMQVPAGTIEPGEPAEAAARRELFEESGFAPGGPLTQFAISYADVTEYK
ncbi:MAG: NUDIX domain-containing protein, partial [Frankiaceae bacterium]|nr:NUDIX domain-containing protein [Frankiaceae bacterium]